MKSTGNPMRPRTRLALAMLLLPFTAFAADSASTPSPSVKDGSMQAYTLTWSDEFNGPAFDTAKWDFRTDSKMWSTQKPENIEVSGGTLKLHVKKEEAGDKHYTGAGVISKEAFRYGYYEARMKVPPGAGWHTSFWMMLHNGTGGTAPNVACQELDVIENDSIHKKSYGVNIHKWKGEHIAFGGKSVKTPDLSADFHVFGCEFTPTTVKYFFDGELVQLVDVTHAVKKGGAPVDFEHGDQHVWLTTISSPLGGTKAVDDTTLPAAAEFDYIRFFTKK
jgi:beta-glucanase (GH16 family)